MCLIRKLLEGHARGPGNEVDAAGWSVDLRKKGGSELEHQASETKEKIFRGDQIQKGWDHCRTSSSSNKAVNSHGPWRPPGGWILGIGEEGLVCIIALGNSEDGLLAMPG